MPAGRPKKNQEDALMKSAELIGWAIGGLEREITHTRERLAALTAQAAKLRSRAGSKPGRATAAGAADAGGGAVEATRKRKRRKMTPEGRKRISDMMKKRWAERRKDK